MDPQKIQQFREAAIAQGYSSSEVDKFIQTRVEQQAALSLMKSGNLDVNEVAKSDPVLAAKAVKEGVKAGTKTKELSVEEKKYKNLGESGTRTLSQVKDMYEKDPGVLNKQLVPGQFFSRDFDSALFNTVDALLRVRTGAQAPESEVRAYMKKLGPTFGDSPEVVEQKLNNLQSEFASISEKESKPVKLNVKGEKSSTGNPLTDFLLGDSVDIAKDVGTGIRAIQTQPTLQMNEQMATQFEDQAQQTQDPMQKKQLLKQANDIRRAISSEAGDISQSFSGDVQDNPFIRSLFAAGEVTSAAALPGMAMGAKNFIGNLGKNAKSNLTFKGIGAQKEAAIEAAKDLKFSGDDIAKAAEEYVKHDPLANPVLQKILPSIKGQIIGMKDLQKKISVWNDAYTQAGKVGKSAEAGVNNVLAKTAKDLVAKSAPAVAEANKKFVTRYKVGKELGRAAFPLSLAAGGGVGGGIIQYLLGGRQ